MEYSILGSSNLKVSKICFGSLTIGPLQSNLSIDEGSGILNEAFEKGINFIDTAELYENYEYIKKALKSTTKDIIVSSRCYAYTREMAVNSLEKARRELDRDVIDIFGLHEQESEHTLRGHREALEYFLEAKSRGLIRAVSVSTHHIRLVNVAAKMKEIDVIHPILNYNGLGIVDGTAEQMINAIKIAHENGKGIYTMKPFGGGNLLNNFSKCIDYLKNLSFIHSIAIGMKNKHELYTNVKYFEGEQITDEEIKRGISEKKLHIEFWCEKCGKCVAKCSNNALSLKDNIVIDQSKCLLCGYCSTVCPAFAIRII